MEIVPSEFSPTDCYEIELRSKNSCHSNIPARDLTTDRCHITSQNHGYAIDASTLPDDWKEYFINLNDQSNEGNSLSSPFWFKNIRSLMITYLIGIIHKTRPIFGTQFHPEARGGPLDSSYLFDIYLDSVRQYKANQSIYQPTRDSRPNPMLVDLLSKERVGVVPTVGMMNMMHGGKMIAAKA